jgi:hypothetical protein
MDPYAEAQVSAVHGSRRQGEAIEFFCFQRDQDVLRELGRRAQEENLRSSAQTIAYVESQPFERLRSVSKFLQLLRVR